jgi:Kdo2-lipid IVA lauroyltransferase/acyltransferase
MGRLSWALSSRMTETTKINLQLCYPDDNSKHPLLARSSIINTFQTVTESGPAWLWPTEKVLEKVLQVEGLEFLQEAQANGRGTVVLAPHLGNWEVFGVYLNNCGCGPNTQLYQAPKNKHLDKLIYNARSRSGAKLVATNNKGVALLLKSLKMGEIVGILPDQVPPVSGGDYAPLFGKEVLTMTLVSRLIQKTGAKAVLGFATRIRSGKESGWKIIFRKPDELIYAEHIQTSLAAMNRSIESAVNEFPEQYQWEYKRFKRVPPDEFKPY